MSKPDFGKAVVHGKNLSATAETAIPIKNPDLVGNNHEGDSPKDFNAGNVTPPVSRKVSQSKPFVEGKRLGINFGLSLTTQKKVGGWEEIRKV